MKVGGKPFFIQDTGRRLYLLSYVILGIVKGLIADLMPGHKSDDEIDLISDPISVLLKVSCRLF